jgi:hypothetical protein
MELQKARKLKAMCLKQKPPGNRFGNFGWAIRHGCA